MLNALRKLKRKLLAPPPAPFLMKDNPAYQRYSVGKYSYGFPGVVDWVAGSTKLSIGAFCSFAGNVSIMLGGDHHVEWVSTYPFRALFPGCGQMADQFRTKGDIRIGNDVWVGQDVMILAGVTIGDGAVIAARSVVARDIPAYAIAGGVPAKVLKMRFAPEVIEALGKIQWWNWPDEKIGAAAPMLLSEDLSGFIEKYGQ